MSSPTKGECLGMSGRATPSPCGLKGWVCVCACMEVVEVREGDLQSVKYRLRSSTSYGSVGMHLEWVLCVEPALLR